MTGDPDASPAQSRLWSGVPEPAPHHPLAAVALGSNLGDRRAHLDAAIRSLARLPLTSLAAVAPICEYPAMGRPGVDPGGPFLNTVCLLATGLAPRELLRALHAIERSHGRRRTGVPPWSPRTLDLDLLVHADHVLAEPRDPILGTPGLTIPHPRLAERLFVLEPLAQIAPGLTVPPANSTIAQLLARLHSSTSQPNA